MITKKILDSWTGKRIFGLLTQAGTAAPTFVTKNKSIAGTFVWARTGVGTYTLTGPADSFPVEVIIRSGVYDQATGKMISGVRTSATVLTFKHGIAAGAASDVFTNVPIEIIVY